MKVTILMKKDTYYFSHDANARKDEKILTLLAAHGYEGYGIYWALVEMMFENSDTAISRKLLNGIAYDMRIDIAVLKKVITTCYAVKLFQADKEKIWSNSLRRRKSEWEEKKKKHSEAGKRGMATRWGLNNDVITKPNAVITIDNKGKESKVKEKKVNKRKVFVAPTLEDVKKYFDSKGFPESLAEKAFEYYDTSDWHDSEGKRVFSWKQKMFAVWMKEENRLAPEKKSVSSKPVPTARELKAQEFLNS